MQGTGQRGPEMLALREDLSASSEKTEVVKQTPMTFYRAKIPANVKFLGN